MGEGGRMPVPVVQTRSGRGWSPSLSRARLLGGRWRRAGVSPAEEKPDLDRQVSRVVQGPGLGLPVDWVVTEIGSGLDGRDSTVFVGPHRYRAGRGAPGPVS